MKEVDKNGDGKIGKEEFTGVMMGRMKEEMVEKEDNWDDLRRLFKEADLDHSNYLSKEEMRQALLKLNVELTDVQLDNLFRELDLDNNQSIDIDEFVAFLSISD